MVISRHQCLQKCKIQTFFCEEIGDVIKSDLFHFLKRGAKCAITVGLKINHASKRKQAFIPVVLIFITPIHIRS